MLFFILIATIVLILCCLPAIRAQMKARHIPLRIVILASLLLFIAAGFVGGGSGSEKNDSEKPRKTVSTREGARHPSSSESQSSKQAVAEISKGGSSAGVAADENHDFQGFVEKPLPFKHQRQMSLAALDGLGRARDAHIQLRNSDEPQAKREPYLTYDPAGWHNYRFFYISSNGQTKKAWLMNRGHLVGYQFSGLNDEGRNLVAETAWLNTGNYVGTNEENPDSMLFYEEGLDNWLSLHPNFYLDYQVTPLYQGNELLPRQVRLAYVGLDKQGRTIKINLGSAKEQAGNGDTTLVYLENRSSNASIDYSSGRAVNTVANSHSQAAVISSSHSQAAPQSSASPAQRTVYVTGDGHSPVYWYSQAAMPKNTNRARIKVMTEQQALNQGKHHSKTEP